MAFVKTEKVREEETEGPYLVCSNEDATGVICKSPGKLQRLLSSLKVDRQVHYISDGDWSMHDLVISLIDKYKPAELFITTYALRELPVRQLVLAQGRGDITAVNMILDYRTKVRTPEVYQLAEMNSKKIFLTSIHAKVTVIKSAAGYVSIVGSANWTKNPKIEAGVISLEKNVAEFHINWIKRVMNNAEIFS